MDDAELVLKASEGDTGAFSLLISRYANAVYGVAYARIRDYHLAQDVAQEVFIRAYLKLRELREPSRVGSWLYAITRRVCADWIKSDKSTSSLNEAICAVPPDDTKLEVWQALNALPNVSRLPVILYHIDGYSIREIAGFLALTPEAVESRLRRARQILRRELLNMVEEDLRENRLGVDFEKRVSQLIAGFWESAALGRQDDALVKIREAVGLKPDDAQLRERLAETLLVVGENTGEIALIKEAEALYNDLVKNDQTCYRGLGQIYMALDDFDKAIECFIKVSGKKHVDVTNQLIEAYLRKGDYEAAMSVAQPSVFSSLSTTIIGLFNLVIASQRLKDTEKAKAYCRVLTIIIDSLGEEPGPPFVKWSSYLLFAEVALSDNDTTAAISGIRAAKALAKKEMEVRPPFLFDGLTNALISRNSDATDLEWFLQNIVSDRFSALRGNDDYEQIVKSTMDDIADARS